MADNNNQIQNFSNNIFSNNNQNNSIPVTLRQSNKEMLLNINPDVFQTTILNSINNFLNNNRSGQYQLGRQYQLGNQIMQQVGNELQNMADNLVDAFKIVKDSIDDLREKCGSSYSDDKNYKDINDKNINILADQNSALQEKTSILENSNKNIIDTNNKRNKQSNRKYK